jgi:hypothetical protein
MTQVPEKVVEFILLGRNRPDEILRYTQDAGVVTDIWLRFAQDPVAVDVAVTARRFDARQYKRSDDSCGADRVRSKPAIDGPQSLHLDHRAESARQ